MVELVLGCEMRLPVTMMVSAAASSSAGAASCAAAAVAPHPLEFAGEDSPYRSLVKNLGQFTRVEFGDPDVRVVLPTDPALITPSSPGAPVAPSAVAPSPWTGAEAQPPGRSAIDRIQRLLARLPPAALAGNAALDGEVEP